MKKWLLVLGLIGVLSVAHPAEAAVTDWPIIGQVAKVGICVISGAGQLVTSLLGHLTAWGKEGLTTTAECITKIVTTPVDIVTTIVGGAEEAPHE